jgi:rhodanese-related sulfurtransferase
MLQKVLRVFIALGFVMLVPPALAEKADVQESVDGTTRVSAEEVIELLSNNPDLVIVDARKASDRAKGYIEGSIGLPDTETTQESLAANVPAKDSAVMFYCNGVKCGRSVKSAKNAVSWGYSNVYWFRGGWEEWTEKGYPVTK